jgi:hypothetical protein
MCSWRPPVQKTKKAAKFSNPAFWKEHEPSPFMLNSSFFTKKKEGIEPYLRKSFVSLFSPKLNGQPAFKFNEDMDVVCIYCMIQRNMHLDVERVHERYQTGPAQAYFKCRPQIGPVRMVLCKAFSL